VPAAAAAAAPVAAVVAAPVVAAEKPKKAAKAVAQDSSAPVATSAPVAASAASASAAAPVASAAVDASGSSEQVEQRSVDQEINDLVKLHQTLRDQAVAAIKNLQKLQKRVSKEIKEAGRRRRRVKKEEENGAPKEKRPTIFTTPVTLKDELCAFLGKPKGSQMTPAEVTRAFSAYVELHKLKDASQGHTIHPDAAMRKVLGLNADEKISYRTVQRFLYKLYDLPSKAATASKQ